MPGKLVVSSLSTGSSEVDLNGLLQNQVKAWADIEVVGGVPSLRGGFNVSSITDRGVGVYTINYTKVLPSNIYSFVANAADTDNHGDAYIARSSSASEYTASSTGFYTAGGGGKFDPPFMSILVVC